MTLVVVDTETTGFGMMGRNPRPDGIVSVGLAWRNQRGRLCTWEERCNPGEQYISGGRAIEALRINGLDEDMLRRYPPAEETAERVRQLLLRLPQPLQVTSYNVAFDRSFLEQPPWDLCGATWTDCIMLRATPPEGRWLKLKVACEQYGIITEGALHSSGWDASRAYLLMEALDEAAVHA